MNNAFDNVKDSSIWVKPSVYSMVNGNDNRLYIGVVREVRNVKDTNELRYMVEVKHKTDTILTNCRMLRRHGGVFNYEDFIMQGYNYNGTSNNQNGSVAVAGDIVLIGQFGGNGREGVILGSLTHPARKSFLDVKKGPQYKSEFNGVETWINENGEYTLTFKGQPTNLSKLAASPNAPIPKPEYDKNVGGSYLKWDKTGSFTIDDNATDGDKNQRFFIDKKNGTIQLSSGKVSLKIKKSDQSAVLTCKTFDIGGGAQEALLLGTTFRKNQKSMNNTLSQQFTQLGIAMAALATAAGTPPLTPLATAFGQAATACTQAAAALTQFEAKGAADDYQSKVSKTK